MAVNEKRLAERSKNGILAGVIILSVAIGILVWQFGGHPDEWYQIFYGMFTVIGLYLVIASFFEEKKMDLSPSQSSYYLVTGTIIATIGILGMVSVYVENTPFWIYIVVFIIVLALLVIMRSISKKG